MRYDVAVIGGGAGGMATAILCARAGMRVLLVESADRVLKKVLATGNGRCNFSNVDISSERYNTPFVATALERFGSSDAVAFFESLGMMSVVDDGRLYPYSRQAQTVVFALMNGARESHVDVRTGEMVTRIDAGYTITTTRAQYTAKALVIATGSNATSGVQSYDLVRAFGHNHTICMPSLTYLCCPKDAVAGLSGIRIKARATIETESGRLTRSGELLFKKDGISGIMIFELSSFFARRVVRDQHVTIDMAPEYSEAELVEFFERGEGDTLTRLMGLLPKQLAILVDKMASHDLRGAVRLIKGYRIEILSLGDIKNAQVVSGGLDVRDFDEATMESKKAPNLYAVGEVLDVDGECGGYNLHWAWASAHAVARSIVGKHGEDR